MEFEKTGLNLVPRGVEGTGVATILDNNQTVQSLARLSGRMDNLYRLKLLAGAKKEKAVVPPKESKVFQEGLISEAGLLSGLNRQVIQDNNDKNNEKWKNWDDIQRYAEINKDKEVVGYGNNGIKEIKTSVSILIPELEKRGWKANQQKINNYEVDFTNDMATQAKDWAAKNNVTDPRLVRRKAHELAFSTNSFPTYLVNKIKSDPDNINLNTFGDNVFKDIGTKGIKGTASDGSSVEINSSNLFPADVNGNQALDKNLAITAILSNEEDRNIFTSAAYSPKNLLLAAGQTGDATAAAVTQKFIDAGNRTDNPKNLKEYAFNADEIKLLNDKILPEAEDNVLARMFAGRNNLKIVQDKQTTRQTALQKQVGTDEADSFTNVGDLTIEQSFVAANPKGGDVIGLDGYPIKGNKAALTLSTEAKTRTLKPNDYFSFAPGSKVIFLDAIPISEKQKIASRNADGTWTLNKDFRTNDMTYIPDDIYITSGETPVKIGKSNGFMPKGVVVDSKAVGASLVKDKFAYVTVDDYLDNFYSKEGKEKKLDDEASLRNFKGIRFLIGLNGNNAAKTKFERETGDVKFGMKNAVKQNLNQK